LSSSRFHIRHFERLGSTNAYATSLPTADAPHRTVIVTDDQFAGRGQKGNTWYAAPGQNLTFSLILRLSGWRAEDVFYLSKCAALMLMQATRELLPQSEVLIKWPNDLLIDGQKAVGILIENQLEGAHLRGSILGIGLNVNQIHFDEAIRQRTTSLKLASGQDFSPRLVLLKLLEAWEPLEELLLARDWPRINRLYLKGLYGYQETRLVRIEDEIMEAMIVGVEASGRLALVIAEEVRYFDIKEVHILLPSEYP